MIRLDVLIEKNQKVILEAIRKRDGISVSEQVRRAIEKYIKDKQDEYNNRRNLEKTKRAS